MKFGAAILAGGKSLRMGEDKALIKYRGQTLLERLSGELSSFDELLISMARPGDYELPQGAVAVYDSAQDSGPMEGIHQVLLGTRCDYVFICAVDMPFLTGDLARYIQGYVSSDYDCYVIKDDKHFHPLCAIYSKAVLPVIEELLSEGKLRLMDLLERVRTKYISLEQSAFSQKQVTNVNTNHELVMAVRPVVFCVSGTKDSGKTWLISRLINEFISDGLSVGVIKHDGHEYTMDHEGSDTSVFSASGALFSAIYSDTKYSINVSDRISGDDLGKYCPHSDVVIYEGRKGSDIPKLWVQREQSEASGFFNRDTAEPAAPLMGVVTDSEAVRGKYLSSGTEVFGFGDIHAIYTHIRDYFHIM